MQRVAMASAARCGGWCSVLRFSGWYREWFLVLGLEGWQGGFCGCVERAVGLHKDLWAGLQPGVCRAVKTCSRAVCKAWVCLCFSPWDGLSMVFWLKFDSVFNVEASVKADTAYYYEKQKLWKLMSNVDIQNLKGERFETDLLYWDQNKHTIYSDQFIRIEQPDRIITGHGFDSNEQMTIYTIRKPEGIFYVDDDATAPADSLQTDSVQTGSVRTDSIKP